MWLGEHGFCQNTGRVLNSHSQFVHTFLHIPQHCNVQHDEFMLF